MLTVISFSVSENLCNPFSCVGIVGNPVVQYSTMNKVTNLQLQCKLTTLQWENLVSIKFGEFALSKYWQILNLVI